LQEALDLELALIGKFALGSTDEAHNLALGAGMFVLPSPLLVVPPVPDVISAI
jgi:hypothetical protein